MLCCSMCACRRRSKSAEAPRFLATTLWMWTEHSVTVGEPEREGRRKSPRTTSRTMPHVSLLDEASVMTMAARLGSAVSLLSKMARSVLPAYAMIGPRCGARDHWLLVG